MSEHGDLLVELRAIRALLESRQVGHVLDLQGAAAYLGISERTLRQWVDAGKVRASRLGHALRFRRVWLDAALDDSPARGCSPDTDAVITALLQ